MAGLVRESSPGGGGSLNSNLIAGIGVGRGENVRLLGDNALLGTDKDPEITGGGGGGGGSKEKEFSVKYPL